MFGAGQPELIKWNIEQIHIVDTFNLTGPVGWFAERINELMELGLHGVSCVQYAVLDQKTNMRQFADRLMPLFR